MGFDFIFSTRVEGEERAEQERKYIEFYDQLGSYYSGGEMPKMASPDIRYALTMQSKRLKKHGVTVSHRYAETPKNQAEIPFCSLRFNSNRHHVYFNYNRLTHEIEYKKDDRVIGGLKDKKSLLYQYSVYMNEEQNLTDKDVMCCPNCGAINKITELIDGCRYCKTRFEMSTIFPVISNYFYNCRPGYSGRSMIKILGTGAAIFGIGSVLLAMVLQFIGHVNIIQAIITAIIAGVMGAFFGYVLSSVFVLGFMFVKAIAATPAIADTSSTKKKVETFMRAKDEFFSYEFFAGTAQALLRTVLLSDNPEELSFYDGNPPAGKYKNILDSVYMGDMSFEACKEENGYIYLYVGLYMNDSVLEGSKVNVKARKYIVGFRRKRETKTDYAFSIHKVECKGCGGSFDATVEKKCPYCGNSYEPEDDDWVIHEIRRVKEIGYLKF